MYRCLVHYPKIDTTMIEEFRKKYDFTYDLIKAHITIVFPNDVKISGEKISKHVKSVLSSWKSFDIKFEGFTKSFDNWLFLTITKGNDKIIQLYKDLYTDILSPYRKLDIFIPHIGLGYFSKKEDKTKFANYLDLQSYKGEKFFDEQEYKKALLEAEKQNFVYSTRVDELTLIDLDKSYSSIIDIEIIKL